MICFHCKQTLHKKEQLVQFQLTDDVKTQGKIHFHKACFVEIAGNEYLDAMIERGEAEQEIEKERISQLERKLAELDRISIAEHKELPDIGTKWEKSAIRRQQDKTDSYFLTKEFFKK